MNIKKLSLLLLTLASTVCLSATVEPNSRAEREISVLCDQLFADYAINIDHLNPEGFASTFTEDGEFVRASGVVKGRENLQTYISEHGDQAHMIMFTTSDVSVLSDVEATGLAYAIILNGDRRIQPGDKPIQMNGITAASEYRANFKLTNEGWKISRMEITPKFRGPGYVH